MPEYVDYDMCEASMILCEALKLVWLVWASVSSEYDANVSKICYFGELINVIGD